MIYIPFNLQETIKTMTVDKTVIVFIVMDEERERKNSKTMMMFISKSGILLNGKKLSYI